MSEYKKEMIVATVTGVLLVGLISGVIYILFPPTPFELPPRLALSFFLGLGSGASADSMGKNETVYLEVLEIGFDFANGSTMNLPEMNLHAQDLSDVCPDKYSGEINASSLQRVTVKVTSCYGANADIDYTVDTVRNSTIYASLKSVEVVNLGVFERANCIERYVGYSSNRSVVVRIRCQSVDVSSSGYWAGKELTPELGMDVAELSGMLTGSGTALITFDATHSIHLKYNITTGSIQQGETDLSWEGRIGTFEIVYDQGKITWVRYDFTTVKLALLTV